MIVEDKKLEQNKKEEPISPGARTAITGIFGGLLWASLGYLAYLFSFTKIPPNVILEPWTIGNWKSGVLGQFIAIFLIGLISILVAFGYLATLRKFDKIWMGVLFGVVLWGIVFFILNPIFPGIDPIRELDVNTIVTTICLFVLYGTFIGFSISFEASELTNKSEPNYSNE
ncbi:YqhR family membrane protein [Bacillus sp. AK128]